MLTYFTHAPIKSLGRIFFIARCAGDQQQNVTNRKNSTDNNQILRLKVQQ